MMRSRWRRLCSVGFVAATFAAARPAEAIRCSTWNRLGPDQRAETIERMIENGLRSSNARRYQINEARIRDCMYRQIPEIELDFDGTCSNPRRADLQALNRIFKNYAWSCFG